MRHKTSVPPKKEVSVTLDYDKEDFLAKNPAVERQIRKVLEKFAARVAKNVTMHFVKGPAFQPFPKDNALHFVVGAAAPGEIGMIELSHVCGVRLNERGRYIKMEGPTAGIGFLVKDDEKETVAQVVDSTIYLFIPSPSRCPFHFEGSEATDLYSRILDLVWKTTKHARKHPKAEPIESLSAYRECMGKHMGGMSNLLKVQKEIINTQIERKLDELRSLYSQKENYGRLAAFEAQRTDEDRQELPKRDWSRIEMMPLVERVLWVENAMHVRTKRIIVEYEGFHYDFGKFMIRMAPFDTPAVWALCPTHPQRIAHPHISPSGIVCFGNVSVPLAQAAGEGRVADALELVLLWLIQGYDPNLADTKIETWPKLERARRAA